jgi:hypothetical protein
MSDQSNSRRIQQPPEQRTATTAEDLHPNITELEDAEVKLNQKERSAPRCCPVRET